MKQFHNLLAALCFSLVLLPQTALSSQSAGQGAGPTVRAADAAAEEKARNYFSDLEVIDQNGKHLRFYSDVLKDRVVLISFIFTNCQDACPMVAQKLKKTRSLMVDSIRDDVWFVSISVDPERDTPEAMKNFARKQDVDESRWIFLTGDKQNLDTIVRKLGQFTPDFEAHTTLMLAGSDLTRHWTRVVPMTPPAGIAMQMRDLVEESSR
ncbi:MAG: SCO family protein [Gammaproteobacteria bacterium]|nr:MAG: SCO family protein [Gammaproteobacteria bacterium]